MKKLLLILVVWSLWAIYPSNSIEAKAETYTISPNSETYNRNLMNDSNYNNDTKHYYLLRTYLERLEETGGGTLELEKGTYIVSNVLFVPSNTTIKLKDGAKIMNGSETGKSKLNADHSLFHFIRPSLGKKEGVYGGYDGEKNISIIGAGSATIDLNFEKDAIAIIAGHNQNIRIENINFQNMYSGHFIEIDATKDAVITNNKFMNSIPSTTEIKEAINIDTPDKLTNGWSSVWSKFDKTPNSNMKIENNIFYGLDRAIGTHKYSGGKYHDKIIIRNNKIEKMRQDAIRVLNWSNATIENNMFKNVAPGKYNANRGIIASGALNPTFQSNVFIDIPRAMQFTAWKNSDSGSEYDITYNELSEDNKEALSTNTIINYVEDFIRINPTFKKFDQEHTEFIPLKTVQSPSSLNRYPGSSKALNIRGQNNYEERLESTFGSNEDLSNSKLLNLHLQNYLRMYQ
ncbi:right-handed parallel beta-helix repeat-containing protein [Psychrobacillus sp. FSL K6-2684]|uniref:Right-handed parallel beta-helix repeat-containing protein n=1 Tax=Psychrobacillus faecigallinarum TaxID=2762235 RepID=A0ABR8RE59_9BACI|nr:MULTISPECIES: right-handed parallel beta-helix repeat-containing protein [Psychrobacillus]MBD7946041.1 right-handed parallel beta-helix repeat-containing protein [Psychrobacillus faecigallinarum]QEY22009.1 right-handed parallel beta-helix repeat-containing protein [Psychrobacillus sp. AK 1817]